MFRIPAKLQATVQAFKICMYRSKRAALLTLLFFLTEASSTQATAETSATYVPAALNDSRYSLQNRIRFPKLDGNFRETVICDVSLSRGGRFRSNYCYSNEDAKSLMFTRTIHDAAKGAKITPAKIDDIGQWAFYQYSVEFIQQGEERRFIVKSYQGYNKVLSPTEYSAPQRILRKKWSSIPGCPLEMHVGLKVDVSADGSPSNLQFFSGEPNKVCARSIRKWNARQRYIPAMTGTKAVPATYIEYLLGPIDWRASQIR
ncbi:MAG: hypothetical protein AB8B48_15695 [Pseudomonadales bacterium]